MGGNSNTGEEMQRKMFKKRYAKPFAANEGGFLGGLRRKTEKGHLHETIGY